MNGASSSNEWIVGRRGTALAFAEYTEKDELESGKRIGKGSGINETVVVAELRNAEYSIFFCEYTFAQ